MRWAALHLQLLQLLAALTQLLLAAPHLGFLGRSEGTVHLEGTRRFGDTLLFEYRLVRHGKALQVLSEAVVYPMTPGQRAGTITRVEIRSPWARHDEIKVAGGVGQQYAVITFTSAFSQGLDYTIKLYGIPDSADSAGSTDSAQRAWQPAAPAAAPADAAAPTEPAQCVTPEQPDGGADSDAALASSPPREVEMDTGGQ